jgi:MurE/MurF fusion protein
MKQLTTLTETCAWLKAEVVGTLRSDSRKVVEGDAFIAWPGTATDGRAYVEQALAQGAQACLVEHEGLHAFGHAPWIASSKVASFKGLKAMTAAIADRFYNHPSQALTLVAITGTNGKTSSAWWIASAMSKLAGTPPPRCAVVGTLGIGQPPHVIPNGLTTPDPVLLQTELANLFEQGITHCAIEASSIGIDEHRLDSTAIKVAVFTNFSQDHLDYHGSLEAYWKAKRKLFDWPSLAHAVVNIDDDKGFELAKELASSSLDLWTTSLRQPARLYASELKASPQGIAFSVTEQALEQGKPGAPTTVRLVCPIVGNFNVANLLGVIGALRCLGYNLQNIANACADLPAVPGRMELITCKGQPAVVVDYAHTPDALAKALQALEPAAREAGGKLWCVFGCGGDRDASKRPLMAAAAEQFADHLIVTNDNPRLEDPLVILADIDRGFSERTERRLIANRTDAIRTAISQAQTNDIILVAGKGHEPYQDIAGQRHPYSDIDTARAILTSQAGTDAMMCLQDASVLLANATLTGDGTPTFRALATDTRTLVAGDLFVALIGDNFDGHGFVGIAKERGAVGAIVSHALPEVDLPQIIVQDTRMALGQLAAAWRHRFDLPVIAVTGSNGKTTVTQMIAAIFKEADGRHALATQGNLNNEIGVPLMVQQLREHHVHAVFELGMNHPGEIATLASIAQPTVALVNNAQREHLEFMHSVDNVARENGSVILALPRTGIAVFPANDLYTPLWRTMAGDRPAITFSLATGADVVATSIHWAQGRWEVSASTPQGDCSFQLAIAGRHNVLNALAALACALAAGISPTVAAAGLSHFEPVKGRSRSFALQWGATTAQGARTLSMVDDTYNANPDSMKAAVDVLAELPKPSLLVVGDMGEVGDNSEQFHTELGRYAKTMGVTRLMCTGPDSLFTARAFGAGEHFESMQSLCEAVIKAAPTHASILVKGSRFMKMERVIAALTLAAKEREGTPYVA